MRGKLVYLPEISGATWPVVPRPYDSNCHASCCRNPVRPGLADTATIQSAAAIHNDAAPPTATRITFALLLPALRYY